MNIKSILATLVLGSSSVAMADPSVTFSATARGSIGTTDVRDHRGYVADPAIVTSYHHDAAPAPVPQNFYRREGWHGGGWNGEGFVPPAYRPVTLASGLSFAGSNRRFITVGADAGRFAALRIDAAGGRTFIKQVYVQFENGQEQVVRDVDRTLARGEALTLDLDGGRRAIRRIVVYGSDGNFGWRRSAGAFTVTAI
jgi:hypothetical protein